MSGQATRPDREERGRRLLSLARGALGAAFARSQREEETEVEPWLAEPGACFVTLLLAGELRGCIGSLAVCRTLGEDVRRNAVAAAFNDPRFPALTEDELPAITIEISLLSPMESLTAASDEELLPQLRPGVDGLVLECGPRRGTFLPQVWEQLQEPGDFLRHLKRKAGLDEDLWSPGTTVRRYTVEKFAEDATPP